MRHLYIYRRLKRENVAIIFEIFEIISKSPFLGYFGRFFCIA